MSFGQWPSDYLGVPLEERFNFNPLTYFLYSGVDGAWFDPSDMSTMYQDAAGTTPVTALEQPVGLWLDKSQGLELGPELVTNGTFDTDLSGWTQGESVSTTNISNAASMSRNGKVNVDLAFRQTIALTSGKTYKLIFNASVSNCAVKVSNSIPEIGPIDAGTGVISYIFTAISNTAIINFWPTTNPATTVIDNVSVREIKGNHATQSITASRPTLSARYNWLLNSATLATQSVTTVAAQYTLSFTGTGSVTLSGTATGTLSGTGASTRVSLAFTPTAGTLTLTVTGSVTLAMLSFGSLTTYQAITTATNYDSAGWPRYARFDGIDDYLNLPYMGLYANGSASVVAALSNSSTDSEIVAEANHVNTLPTYRPARQLTATLKGSAYRTNASVQIAVPVLASPADLSIRIVSCVDSGINFNLRDGINGQSANVPYTRGVTTLTNTTIGALVRTTTGGYHNGPMYGIIITKSALSDTDRRRCEQFLAGRLSTLGVTLS